jgi:hypothetical protein
MAGTTFGVVLLATLVTAGGTGPGAEEMRSVTYRLTDLAGVPPGILEAGAAFAESAFNRVGLRLKRDEPPAATIPGLAAGCAPRLHVLVLAERSFRAANPHPDAHGYTASGVGAPAAAIISFQRIERTAARCGVAPVVLFGHVMAHELGHLLLGRESRGGAALMKEAWGSSELVRLAQRTLRFSPAERRRLRARIEQRALATAGCEGVRRRSRVE